jgi:hypothetical protein
MQGGIGPMARLPLLSLLAGTFALLGAEYQTENFIVNAPSDEIGKQIGLAAEKYRREKAVLWLGHAMPRWSERCPITVKVTMGGPGGATSFVFDQGRVLRMNMEIEGPLDRLLASVLPHEVTHTVFAYYFRRPVPRWADEGGSVLSEDDRERVRHDQLVRLILNQGRAIPLHRLFGLKDYPGEVMCLYAQGYSVTRFLVRKKGRRKFLAFVFHGMKKDWDRAARKFYGYKNVEKLECAWRKYLKKTRVQPKGLAVVNKLR